MPESKKKKKEFKSFFKDVGGNEGDVCNYSTRLDTYGCGCQHDCDYCYAKSLLDFRGLWNPKEPAVADIDDICKTIANLPREEKVVRLGGMTDCFQPIEERERLTYETIDILNSKGIGYLIVTKSDLVAEDKYVELMDKNLAHIQVSITCTDDDLYHKLRFEKAIPPSRRIKCAERLEALGFDTQIRLSPFIPEFIDFDKLADIKCNKMLVEFLRVNSWIRKWLGDKCDLSAYTNYFHGYHHLPFEKKREYISKMEGTHRITVCDFEPEYLDYWKKEYNPNPNDCCDLRL